MRAVELLSILAIAAIGWGISTSGREPLAAGTPDLTLIPTAFQELTELRINTGEKAILNDGTMSAVYVKKVPAAGNLYLNFHIHVSSEAGPFVLYPNSIVLQSRHPAIAQSDSSAHHGALAHYAPMDWFIDGGAEELRGDSLSVKNKALVQFTIEVPRAAYDDLTLFVLSQQVGTVREIRATITRDSGIE